MSVSSIPPPTFTSTSPPDHINIPTWGGPESDVIQNAYDRRPGCYVLTNITYYSIAACTEAGGGIQYNPAVANASEWPHQFCYLAGANRTGTDRIRASYQAYNMYHLGCILASESAGTRHVEAVERGAIPVMALLLLAIAVLPVHAVW